MSKHLWQPGKSANPAGRPVGIKDRRTRHKEMFECRSEELVSRAIEMALEGDSKMMIACIDRITPKSKVSIEDYVSQPLPDLPTSTPEQIQLMIECIISQAQLGERPLPEAEILVNMYKKMLDSSLNVKQYGEIKDWMIKVETKLGIDEKDKIDA